MGLFSKDYRKELLKICKSLPNDNISIPEMFWDDLYSELCAFSSEQYKEYFNNNNQTMESYATHFTYNYIADILSTGQYHIYSGTLTPNGVAILNLYKSIKNMLLVNGEENDTPDFLDENERQLLINIKNVG